MFTEGINVAFCGSDVRTHEPCLQEKGYGQWT